MNTEKLPVAIILFILVLLPMLMPKADGHTTPTTAESTYGNQAGSPVGTVATCATGGGTSAGQESGDAILTTTPGTTYLLVVGVGASTTASPISIALSNGTDFQINRDGTITFNNPNPGAGHLLKHVNTSSTTFWAWVEFQATSTVNIKADTTGGSSRFAYFTPTTHTGEILLGNKYKQGGGSEPPQCSAPTGSYVFLGYNITSGSFPTPPGSPTLSAVASNATVNLTWGATNNTDHYFLFYDTVSHPGTLSTATFLANLSNITYSYLHTGLTNNVTLYYHLLAINSTGSQAISNEAKATPNPTPNLIVNLVSQNGQQSAQLQWDTAGYTDILNYTLYRGTNTTNPMAILSLLPESTGYNDPLIPGQVAYYYVTVTNSSGTSGHSNAVRVQSQTLFNWSGNLTRIVPDYVTVFINRTFQETYWIDAVRYDRDGVPHSIMTATEWNASAPSNYTYRYPQFRATNATLDAPSVYHVFITDGNGHYLDGRNFCIGTTWSFGTGNLTICSTLNPLDDSSKTLLALASSDEVKVATASQATAQTQQTSQELTFNFLTFFLSPNPLTSSFGWSIPNIFLMDLAFLVVFVAAIFRPRRD